MSSPSTSSLSSERSEDRILTVKEMRDVEAKNIQAALKRSKGKIYGDDGAAKLLGMKPTTLISRIKALNIHS